MSAATPANGKRPLESASEVVHKRRAGWLRESDVALADFQAIVEQETDASDYPLSREVVSKVLIYHRDDLSLDSPEGRDRVAAEWMKAFLDGPGIIAIKGAFAQSEMHAVDAVTEGFMGIIAQEKEAGGEKGDHFGKPGANSRIWNSHEKLAVFNPHAFVDYYSNPVVALVSRAWLGTKYQITAQVNVVHPGGAAQEVHRDYHLGFMTQHQAASFPAHVHEMLSPLLTLQGAVAHCDMPIESGPTLYLPHSQKYKLGYLAWRQQEFKDYFAKHRVQLPLSKGDMVFFNPALFHAAGANVSKDIHRVVNLLQVNSAFGRSMETVNRSRLTLAVYEALLKAIEKPGWSDEKTENAIAASAEGYPFPANLDLDQPLHGLAPSSQADVLARAVKERWPLENLEKELKAQERRKCSV